MLSRLLLLLLAVCAGTSFAGGEPEVTIYPGAPRPGDVLLISLRPEKELLRAACSWGGRSYQFLSAGDSYGLALPVSLEARAGRRRATLYWKYADGDMGKHTLDVQIVPREFGVQRLRLSAAQESRYSAPQTERERQLIGAALDRVGKQRHWQGRFLMPVEGRISTSFGLQRYINGRLAYRHRGLDIAAPEGTPVRAAADGVVTLAEDWFLLHGQTVVIDHGHGVSSLYIHLSEILVEQGHKVAQGQVIGRVGATGVATGPHLHFAVYAYHQAVDPLFWTGLPPT